MSSFNSKVARAKKGKDVQPKSQPSKKSGKEEEEISMAENIPVVKEQIEQVEQNGDTTLINETSEHTEELYGEDQEDHSKSKWQREIPLDRIRTNPFQPRKTFDPAKLNELADGMREHGWIGGGLPVRAHTTESNIYELVWGERRWRAAKIAGLKTIPCVVSYASDEDMIEQGLLENIQREDLTNLEEGLAYVNLLTLRTEQGKPRYSIRRLAKQIGKDKSYIEERLKYARVPVNVQQLAIDQPDISPRIIHELGELAKELNPEEIVPVIEGVRDGRLRIEDVREIRKDVEEKKQVDSDASVAQKHTPIDQLVSVEATTLPTTTSIPITTEDTLPVPIKERQEEVVGQERIQPTIQRVVSTPEPTTMTAAIVISVFEKSLKRDNEALERIFQRISGTFETLTPDEQSVLRRYIQRWNTSLQGLISKIEEPSFVEEEVK